MKTKYMFPRERLTITCIKESGKKASLSKIVKFLDKTLDMKHYEKYVDSVLKDMIKKKLIKKTGEFYDVIYT